MQEMGHSLFRQFALAEAAAAGELGAKASFRLGAGFDTACATVIERGAFTLDIDPLEMLLGDVPLLQLGILIPRSPRPGPSSHENATEDLTFLSEGAFVARAAFRPYLDL